MQTYIHNPPRLSHMSMTHGLLKRRIWSIISLVSPLVPTFIVSVVLWVNDPAIFEFLLETDRETLIFLIQ